MRPRRHCRAALRPSDRAQALGRLEVGAEDPTVNATKPPHRADDPSAKASSSDPSTWSSYAAAVATVKAGKADGIGYVLTHADALAQRHRRARPRRLSRSRHRRARTMGARAGRRDRLRTCETTVSWHRLAHRRPRRGRRPSHEDARPHDGGSVEFYRRATRYITVSGLQISGGSELQNIDELLDRQLARGLRRKRSRRRR